MYIFLLPSAFLFETRYIACQQELFDRRLHRDVFSETGFLEMANSLASDKVVNVRIGISRLLSGFLGGFSFLVISVIMIAMVIRYQPDADVLSLIYLSQLNRRLPDLSPPN